MTTFDLLAGLIILVSGAVGYVRGATRELVTALSFVLAIAISVILLRFTAPLGRAIIDPDWIGVAAALLVVFVIAFIALRLLGGRISHGLLETQVVGMLDRTVGFGIGLIRALVVLGAFWLLFTAATPQNRQPNWITDAALYPLTQACGKMLMAFAPQGQAAADKLGPAIEDAVREEPGETSGETGYSDDELRSVDELVEKSR